MVLRRHGPSWFGRQKRTRAEPFKFPSHVFNKKVVSHG
ncbi:hypothetical protein RintRC_0844 [Richelia intracellularis]|nr:hypothetical protein RintRC_0844 [Richelia intracellularis]